MDVKKEIGIYCITMEAGLKLADAVRNTYKNGEIVLDFAGVKVFATPFFNGLLHAVSTFGQVEQIKPINLPPHGDVAYVNALNNFKAKQPEEVLKDALKRYVDSHKS